MDDTRLFKEKIILIILGILMTTGCVTVNVPNVGQSGYAIEEDERRLIKRSDEATEQINESSFVYSSVELEEYITHIANDLAKSKLNGNNLNLTVKILNDPVFNAFAMPNGQMYVDTGILAAVDNEAQLATILSHELTHVAHRHSLKQFRSALNKSAFWNTLALPINIASGGIGMMVAQLTLISSVTGYSQELETEADLEGYKLMKDLGYDTKETVKTFQKLSDSLKDEKISEPFFFSDHPRIKERIASFKKLIEENPDANNGKTNEEKFQRMTKPVILFNAQLSLQSGFFKSAEKNIEKYIQLYPQEKEGYYFKGELYRQRQDPHEKEKKRLKEKDYPLALEAFDKSLAIDSSYDLSLKSKARVLQTLGKKEEAKEYFQRYLEVNPNAQDRAYIEKYLK